MDHDQPASHPLDFLVGTWEGEGRGEYPSVDDFPYLEVLEIAVSPKGYLRHAQRTTHAVEGEPLHAETGFWRVSGPGRVELVLAHPTGVVEVCEGHVDGTDVHVRSSTVGCSGSAKPVQTVERWYEVRGDVLHYRLSMGAVGIDHRPHLAGELRRQ